MIGKDLTNIVTLTSHFHQFSISVIGVEVGLGYYLFWNLSQNQESSVQCFPVLVLVAPCPAHFSGLPALTHPLSLNVLVNELLS